MLLLLVAAPVLTGCYGHFPHTRHVYDLNDDFTAERFVHAFLMWIPGIVVYPVAAGVDIFLFNPIRFWTGNITQMITVHTEEAAAVTFEPNDPGDQAALQ